MGGTAPDPRGLGQSLLDITVEPTGDPEVDLLAGDELVAAAEGTPYLRRLRALREHVIDAAMRAVPCLLYQHVVKAGRSTPIAPALEVLHEEALLAASRMPGPVPVPSRPRVAAQLRAMLALHVELGLVSWEADGTVTGVGDAAPTGLGLFGWLVWMAVVDDELPPGFEELAAGAV